MYHAERAQRRQLQRLQTKMEKAKKKEAEMTKKDQALYELECEALRNEDASESDDELWTGASSSGLATVFCEPILSPKTLSTYESASWY